MRTRVSPATVIACVALFFSLAGAGIAAQHYLITSVHQIAPSVREHLRGRAGPRGPQGQRGNIGPQGPAGDVASVANVLSPPITVPPNSGLTYPVDCGPNQIAVGGGYAVDPGITVLASQPADASSSSAVQPQHWEVSVTNTNQESASMRVWAVCAPAG